MAKITYVGESENVEWFGVNFPQGRAIETDDATLIRAAGGNRMFEVSKADVSADTPFDRGAAAAAEDKKRAVPVAYRGKSEAQEWLDGYDSVKPQA